MGFNIAQIECLFRMKILQEFQTWKCGSRFLYQGKQLRGKIHPTRIKFGKIEVEDECSNNQNRIITHTSLSFFYDIQFTPSLSSYRVKKTARNSGSGDTYI
jgi:hypothetical protein